MVAPSPILQDVLHLIRLGTIPELSALKLTPIEVTVLRLLGAGTAPARSVAVNGNLASGQILTATFAGVASAAQWYLTSGAGVISAIAGATNLAADGRSSTYAVQAADVVPGVGITCRATNLALDSAPLIASAVAPTTAAPIITGTPTVGVLFAFTAGATTGAPAPVVTHTLTVNGVGTALPYTPDAGAGGQTLVLTQTAQNIGGIASAAASATIAAGVLAPTVSNAPAIIGSSGTAGVSVSYTPGTYGGSASTVVRQFTLDNVNTGPSAPSGTPYTPASAGQLRVVETATNAAGVVVSTSAPITIAAAAVDTRPGWFAAPSNAATVGTAGFVSGRTILSGSANGGKAGTANPVATSGSNYAWFAIANSGAVTFHDNTANLNGGFVAAGTFTDASSTVWYLYKSDFPASYTSGTDSITIS